MRHFFASIIVLSAIFGLAESTLAQSSQKPHLELVRGLRKQGMADLALQYLDQLRTSNPHPDIAVLMPLEYARTYLDLAVAENDEAKRTGMIDRAKKELETFIAANPKHELTPQANVELARLLALQGKSLLRKARRLEDKKQQEPEMVKARALLLAAAQKYEATVKLLDKQLTELEGNKTPEGAKLHKDLLDFRLRSQLDQGINYFDMGDTFVGQETSDIESRGKQYKEAKKVFEKVIYAADADKIPASWIARAWSAQSELKAGEAGNSEKAFADLLSKRNIPAAGAGIRVAKYFAIVNNFDKSAAGLKKLETACANWLLDYPSYRDSQEGLGARYYLGLAKMTQGLAGLSIEKKNGPPKIAGITPGGKALLEDSQRIFRDLTEGEHEYTERASRHRSQILVSLADAEGRGDAPPLDSLKTFENCYLMAQVQAARFYQYQSAKPAPKTDDEVKKFEKELQLEELRRFRNSVKYLEKGLAIATRNDNLRDVFAARMFLVECYWKLHLYPQAAVLAEYLAREFPKMAKASSAAHMAMRSYNMSLITFKEKKGADVALATTIDAETARLRRSAALIVEKWPTDSVADEARHVMAYFLSTDKNQEAAWKSYSEISPSYQRIRTSRYEMASVMYTLVKPEKERNADKFYAIVQGNLKKYAAQWKTTLAQMVAITEPEPDSPLDEVIVYLDGRRQLAYLYQLEGSYDKAMQTGSAIMKSAPKFFELKGQRKADYLLTGDDLVLNSLRMNAYDAFKKNNYAKVAELIDPRVAEIEKEFAKEAPSEPTLMYQRLRRTQREIVVLALQSSVQNQKIDRAGKLIDVLEKSGGNAEESLGLLQNLIGNIRGQIVGLEADQKKEEANKLKAGFSELLDKIVGRPNLPTKTVLFLAGGYSSVEDYAKAAKLLENVRTKPQPQAPVTLKEKATKEQEAKFKLETEEFDGYALNQRNAQLLLARAYRSAKDYANALKIYEDMIGDVSPKVKKGRQGWAFRSIQVRKEKAQLLEDMALAAPAAGRTAAWVAAAQEWIGMSATFAPQLVAIRKTLPPEGEMAKVLKELVAGDKKAISPPDTGTCPVQHIVWLMHRYGPTLMNVRQLAGAAAGTNSNRRAIYFDLLFEQKRCSLMAYWKIGAAGLNLKPAAYDAKIASVAKVFNDIQDPVRNPDLSQTIKDKIADLVKNKELQKDVPSFAQEYLKLQSGG